MKEQQKIDPNYIRKKYLMDYLLSSNDWEFGNAPVVGATNLEINKDNSRIVIFGYTKLNLRINDVDIELLTKDEISEIAKHAKSCAELKKSKREADAIDSVINYRK